MKIKHLLFFLTLLSFSALSADGFVEVSQAGTIDVNGAYTKQPEMNQGRYWYQKVSDAGTFNIQYNGASWTITGPAGTYYVQDADTEKPPQGGWVTSGGAAPSPTLTGDVDPLPIELTSFNAKVSNGIVSLNWSTATEVNNYGFEIERSENEIEFIKIGFVEGKGNSNVLNNYSFEDRNVSSGIYYYRLTQVDIDGIKSFKETIKVNYQIYEFSLEQNYPNPFNPTTNILFYLPHKSVVTIKVFDLLGREVAVLVNNELSAGKHEIKWNAENFSGGTYIYQLKKDGINITKKMLLLK